jgi:enamine deaminase RidA (YjgF/YER057c/UK114 family)
MASIHTKEIVETDAYPTPFPVMPFSAAVKCNGMVYLSGNIGMDPKTNNLVEGDVKDRTASPSFLLPLLTKPYPHTRSIDAS